MRNSPLSSLPMNRLSFPLLNLPSSARHPFALTVQRPFNLTIVIVTMTVLFLSSCSVYRGSLHLSDAEEQLRLKQYDKAIASYRSHIDYRLKAEDKQEWENPFFYLMLIVDIELKRDNIEGAKEALAEAEAKGVEVTLIADRWRSLARWYELRGKPREAMELLQAHRELDPLLFDSTLDRLAKKVVLLEEVASSGETAPSAGNDAR